MNSGVKADLINFHQALCDKNKRGSLAMRIARVAYLKCSRTISGLFSGHALVPVELNVEVSNQCNLRCRMCPSRVLEPKKPMQPDIGAVVDIIARLGVRIVRFSGLGEPMMAPAFWDIVEAARRCGCRIAMVTNGTMLDKDATKRLCAVSWMLTVSLDSATSETYRYIRGMDGFENLYGVIRDAYREKSIHGRSLPIIAINWVLMKSNYRELPLLIRRLVADGIKIDLIHCDPLVSYTGEMDGEVLNVDEGLTEYLNSVREEGLAAGVLVEYPYYSRAGYAVCEGTHRVAKVGPSCTVLWDSLFLSLDGTFLPCCEYYLNPIGNIISTDPRSAWNSQIMREARRRSLQGLPPFPYCTNCHKYAGAADSQDMLKRARHNPGL